MGLRFRRSLRLLPGVRLNLSGSGVSASFGRRGAWFTVGPRGTRATIGIPGSGLSYTTSSPWRRPPHARPQAPVAAPTDIASIEEPAPSPVAPAVTEPAPEAATPAHAVAPLAGLVECPSCGAQVELARDNGAARAEGDVSQGAGTEVPDTAGEPETFSGEETIEGVMDELGEKPGGPTGDEAGGAA